MPPQDHVLTESPGAYRCLSTSLDRISTTVVCKREVERSPDWETRSRREEALDRAPEISDAYLYEITHSADASVPIKRSSRTAMRQCRGIKTPAESPKVSHARKPDRIPYLLGLVRSLQKISD